MLALLLPASPPPATIAARYGSAPPRPFLQRSLTVQCPNKFGSLIPRFLSKPSSFLSFPSSLPQFSESRERLGGGRLSVAPTGYASPNDESEKEKLAQVWNFRSCRRLLLKLSCIDQIHVAILQTAGRSSLLVLCLLECGIQSCDCFLWWAVVVFTLSHLIRLAVLTLATQPYSTSEPL